MKNLVFIETYNRHGSGVIFACRHGQENSYLVITNYHVIRDVDTSLENLKDYINLEFYDDKGRKIEKEHIKYIRAAYGDVYDNENDIAALLVVLEDWIHIEFEAFVYFDNLQEESLWTEGYPEVLNDDDINRRLKLEGKRESTFPEMKKLGIYKLVDSIHWYKEFTDKELFDGLSGGPVYVRKEGTIYLIGINQSLCNVGEGNNPFKIIYYIQIKQVFEWLRKQGIILFEYHEGRIELEWIYKRTVKPECLDVLLLGGSGAGKSSFVKELLLHGEEVNACGDGQTTRMDINYHLQSYCGNPTISIKVLAKDKFADRLFDATKFNRMEYIFTDVFDLPYIDLDRDMFGYVKMILNPLEGLLGVLSRKDGKEEAVKKIREIVEVAKDVICKNENAEKAEMEELYEDIIKLFRYLSKTEGLSERKLADILYPDAASKYYDDIIEENYITCEQSQITLTEYIERVLASEEGLLHNRTPGKMDAFDVMNVHRGFFDVKEFYYLSDSLEKEIQLLFTEYKRCLKERYWNTWNEAEREERETAAGGKLEKYYEQLYEKIVFYMNDYYKKAISASEKIIFDLDNLETEDKTFIELCLKVVRGNSLSGVIEKIEIKDSISNNYAYMIKKKGIEQLRFIDTCGLDHIDRGNGLRRYLDKVFDEYKVNKVNFDAIFYIKKLDAGKPTELEKILPTLYTSCPGKPIFCVFTGADIFYAGRESALLEYEWNQDTYQRSKKLKENMIPKSVSYFYEDDSVVRQMPCSEEWKKIIYHVITENLIPFVADTQIRDNPDYIVSNRKYLKKLFETMLLDEWNAGYIDSEGIEALLEGDAFQQALEKDIKKMFYKASLFDWNRKHHMTVNANIARLLGQKENSTGYNGVSEDRWDYLLKKGYQEAFLVGKSKTIDVLNDRIGKSQLESMFAKLKEEIVNMDMRYLHVEGNKTKFREIFELMYTARYEDKNIYLYNPFAHEDIKLTNQSEKRSYLADVCDFRKGLENPEIMKAFMDIFSEKIERYLRQENDNRIKLLIKYKDDFAAQIENMLTEIEKLVGEGNPNRLKEVLEAIVKLKEEGKL